MSEIFSSVSVAAVGTTPSIPGVPVDIDGLTRSFQVSKRQQKAGR